MTDRNYDVADYDTTKLPTDLLAQAKVHMRVEFTRDDDYIRGRIARAIDLFERITEQMIFSRNVTWTPLGANLWTHQLPLQPVASWKVMLGPDEISSQFKLSRGAYTQPIYLTRPDRTAFPADGVYTFVAGYESGDKLPLQVLDPVLRIAAHLYEHRESISDQTNMMMVPQWMTDLLTSNWIPRC